MVVHLDSSFLIDLLRETKGGRPGAALEYLEQLDDRDTVCASVHVLCELRVGPESHQRPAQEHEFLDDVLSSVVIVYPDGRFAPAYGRLYAAVARTARTGRTLAAMDLLIATAAVLDDAPLVTRNVKDFSRVPGLRVLAY